MTLLSNIEHVGPYDERVGISPEYYWADGKNRLRYSGGANIRSVWYIALPISSVHGSGHSGGNSLIAEDRHLNDETVYPHASLVEMLTYHRNCFPDIEGRYIDVSHEDWDRLREEIRRAPPSLAAFSVFSATAVWAYIVASEIKIANPDCVIIFGNDHSTLMYDQILNGPIGSKVVDFVGLDNNGPFTVMALILSLCDALPLEKIPSIAYRNGSIVKRQFAPNYPISNRVFPDYRNILTYLEGKYDPAFQMWYGDHYELNRMITAQLDAGCIWGEVNKRRCAHCSIVGLQPKYIDDKTKLQKFLEYIVGNLEANLYNAGDSTLGFHSSNRLKTRTQPDGKMTYLEGLREIHRESQVLSGKRYMLAYGQVSEFLDGGAEIASSFVRTWNVGIESFDPNILKNGSKGVSKGKAAVFDAMCLARELDYKVYASGILGLPGTSRKQLRSEVDNWLSMAQEFGDVFSNITVSLPAIVPGSKMYRDLLKADKRGFITSSFHTELIPSLDLTRIYIEENSPELKFSDVQSAAYEIRSGIEYMNQNKREGANSIKTGTYAYDGLDHSEAREKMLLRRNLQELSI